MKLIFLITLIELCFGNVIKNQSINNYYFKKLIDLQFLYDNYDSTDSKLNDNFKINLNINQPNLTTHKISKDKINPIILIPGLEGSQLYVTLNKTYRSHYYCKKTQKTPFIIWINYEEFVIPAVNCFVENMKLQYDNETRTTKNADGVNVQVPGFGSTESIETLTDNRITPQYYYFKELVDMLVDLNYERNKTIRGAPYDFRLAPNEQDEYFKNLINLIETTYLENNKRKVILVCHSMGCLYSMNLLNVKVTNEWKNRYISTLFAFSSPWAGSIRALKTMVTGDNMGIFLFNDKRFKDMERTFPSIAFLLPNPSKFPSNSPSVITPSKNYTFNDYEELFNRMGAPTINDMYLDTNNLIGNLKHPGVDMHCIYGTGIETERQIIYDKDSNFPNSPKKIIYDTNGDSSVNLESLEYCLKWKDQTKYKFKHKKIDKGDHLQLIRQKTALDYIRNEVIGISNNN